MRREHGVELMTIMVDERYAKAKKRLADSGYAMAEERFRAAFGNEEGRELLAHLTGRPTDKRQSTKGRGRKKAIAKAGSPELDRSPREVTRPLDETVPFELWERGVPWTPRTQALQKSD